MVNLPTAVLQIALSSLTHLALATPTTDTGAISPTNAPISTSIPTVSATETSSTSSSVAPIPTATLAYGTFAGFASAGDNNTVGINQWLGIPYAQPPVDDLRLRRARAPLNYPGVQQATNFGPNCIQVDTTNHAGPPELTILLKQLGIANGPGGTEDCLRINVVAPQNATNLPVFVWIHGGAFSAGTAAVYNGAPIVQRSLDTNLPFVYVSFNYRLNVYGFLSSQELFDDGALNLGLYDQQAALRWVQTYIAEFGGDPTNVKLFGQSAGAWSIGLHLTTPPATPPLFHGAYLFSGSSFPYADYSNRQVYYDSVVGLVNCTGPESLACLRTVPAANLTAAMNAQPSIFSYEALKNTWFPVMDGIGGFIPELTNEVIRRGDYANVPIVSTNVDDEGTLFSLLLENVTTDAQSDKYLTGTFFPDATPAEAAAIVTFYPAVQSEGSPYNTSEANQLGRQFKRISSFQGDLFFQCTRLFFLQHASKRQNVWSSLWKRNKGVAVLGSYHGSDITTDLFLGNTQGADPNRAGYDTQLADIVISFTNTGNPNNAVTNETVGFWPLYNSTAEGTLLTFYDGPLGGVLNISTTLDNYRRDARDFLYQLWEKYPL